MSIRIVARAALAILSLVAMWGCQVDYHAAPPVPYDQAPLTEAERAELNELKAQLGQSRKQLADTRAELATMGGRLNALDGAVQEIRSGAVPGSVAEFGERLAALETEVRTQRELLQVREEELRLLRDAVLPSRDVPADTPVAGPGAGEAGVAPGKPSVPQPAKPPGEVGGVTRVMEQDYENAWKRLKEKDYRGAIQQFEKFVEKHPKSTLTDNAQYWIGESYYALQEFGQAILEFEEVVQKYPDGDKAPAALLKMGFAFAEMDDRVDARLFLQEVIRRYPQTDAAEKAREKIRALDT